MRPEEEAKNMNPDELAVLNLEDINAFLLKIQRNPDHYADEVSFLLKVYLKEFEKVKANPGETNDQFHRLLDFFAHVFEYYEADLKFLADSYQDLLRNFPEQLNRELRFKLAHGLVLFSRKGYWNEIVAIKFFLDLLALKDKEIRSLIFKHMVQLIDKVDHNGRKSEVHKELMDHITERSRDTDHGYSKNIFKLLVALMKKQIWKDSKAANLIAEGTYHDKADIVILCCRFLIENVDNDDLEISSDEEEGKKATLKMGKKAKYLMVHKKKTKSEMTKFEKLKKKVRKAHGTSERKENANFLMIELLYSPLALCDKIFNKMKASKLPFKAKLLQMALISRIVWRFELIFPNFFHYMHRYIKSNNNELPEVLTCLAGCCHARTPLSELQPIVALILQNFANEAAPMTKMVMGVNTLKEICLRIPEAMEEDDIYQICLLRKNKHKMVAGCIRSFINLWRGLNPRKLKKEFRGREWQEEDGQVWEAGAKEHANIAGIEFLNRHRRIY